MPNYIILTWQIHKWVWQVVSSNYFHTHVGAVSSCRRCVFGITVNSPPSPKVWICYCRVCEARNAKLVLLYSTAMCPWVITTHFCHCPMSPPVGQKINKHCHFLQQHSDVTVHCRHSQLLINPSYGNWQGGNVLVFVHVCLFLEADIMVK